MYIYIFAGQISAVALRVWMAGHIGLRQTLAICTTWKLWRSGSVEFWTFVFLCSGQDCCFFDVVTPPYNSEQGRDCTYLGCKRHCMVIWRTAIPLRFEVLSAPNWLVRCCRRRVQPSTNPCSPARALKKCCLFWLPEALRSSTALVLGSGECTCKSVFDMLCCQLWFFNLLRPENFYTEPLRYKGR